MPQATVELGWPAPQVALITVTGPAPNFCTFAQIERLHDRLAEAEATGAVVAVIASDTPGHWLGHACLQDLLDRIGEQPTSGDGPPGFGPSAPSPRGPWSPSRPSRETRPAGALGWACDLRVAAKTARFAQPEVMIGIPAGLGGFSRRVRLIGRSATSEMALDGAALSAARLQACARTPEGLAKIAEVQARYDAGALPADVFDAPFEG